MSVKDAFEVFIKIFHGNGTELMEDASDLDAVIGVRVASILSGHQQTIISRTDLVEFRGVVMAITQDEANFCGNFPQQLGSRITISHIGRRQYSCNGKPDGSDDGNHMQFPPIDPAMPTRFGPMGLGVNRGMGNFPLLAMFLMPHPTASSQDRAIDGHGSASTGPRLA